MFIKRLLIEDIRNLKQVAIDDFATLNFFIGANGAGKTSLLEGIAIASQGRSFRHHKVQTVINQQEPALRVFLECTNNQGLSHKLGIERDRKNQYIIRIDGCNAQTLAELSVILPVLVLDSTSFDLLDGPSSVRRKFIDWGVFHVEPRFFDEWKAFNRILKQRNALLRSQVTDYKYYEPWDRELVTHGVAIEKYRIEYLETYQQHLQATLQRLGAETGHGVFYRNGWNIERLDMSAEEGVVAGVPESSELMHGLYAQFQRDLRLQTTHIGSHKADIQLRLQRNDIKDIYSRGQKKLLVAGMKLAQASTVKASNSQKSPVLLLDDLPSELDDFHLQQFLHYVAEEGYQCFITAVDERVCRNNPQLKARMFHVERGKISVMMDVSRGTEDSETAPINP